jgi:hypothetical protein
MITASAPAPLAEQKAAARRGPRADEADGESEAVMVRESAYTVVVG